MRKGLSPENSHKLTRFSKAMRISVIAMACCVAVPLAASAQARSTQTAKQSQVDPGGSPRQVRSNPFDSPHNPEVEGCGNKGEHNCPPVRCTPCHCLKADCQQQKSCDSD